MKKLLAAVVLLTVVAVGLGAVVWLSYVQSTALKHEPNRWAVIEDVNGNRMAVETTNDNVWTQLVQLNENVDRRHRGKIQQQMGLPLQTRNADSSGSHRRRTASHHQIHQRKLGLLAGRMGIRRSKSHRHSRANLTPPQSPTTRCFQNLPLAHLKTIMVQHLKLFKSTPCKPNFTTLNHDIHLMQPLTANWLEESKGSTSICDHPRGVYPCLSPCLCVCPRARKKRIVQL